MVGWLNRCHFPVISTSTKSNYTVVSVLFLHRIIITFHSIQPRINPWSASLVLLYNQVDHSGGKIGIRKNWNCTWTERRGHNLAPFLAISINPIVFYSGWQINGPITPIFLYKRGISRLHMPACKVGILYFAVKMRENTHQYNILIIWGYHIIFFDCGYCQVCVFLQQISKQS